MSTAIRSCGVGAWSLHALIAAWCALACSNDDTARNTAGIGSGGAGGAAAVPSAGAPTSSSSGPDPANPPAGVGGTNPGLGGTPGTPSSAPSGGGGDAPTGSGGVGGAAVPSGSGGSVGGGSAGTGVTPVGSGGTTGSAGSGGTGGGSSAGAGGIAAGGSAGGGAAGAGSGTGVWQCPAGVTGTPTLGTPTRVASVPPADAFNMNNGTFGIVEGPVWTGDALYLSELANEPYDPQHNDMKRSRLLRVTADGQTSVVVGDSGTNGLALDADGTLVAGVHRDGALQRLTLPDGTATTLVGEYMGARFNSPNDVAIHSSGTLYFSDPSYQAPTPQPQAATRVYRVAPSGSSAEPIPSSASPDAFEQPNGVTLSLGEDYLYVSASVGRRYPVMPDGTLGVGEDWAPANGGDGMAIDCAGNLYVAVGSSPNVAVFEPDGTSIGTISVSDDVEVTNVAFGGEDRQTLYITGLGNNKGLFQLPLNLPGRPY